MKRILSFVLVLGLMFALGGNVLAAAGMSNFKADKVYANFTDVPETAWYHGSVKAAFEYGLVKGSTPTTYNPNGTLTVAEAIVMADRIHILYNTGVDTLTNGTPWYQTYVDYALAQGIITDGVFDNYNRPITRAEMADIFTRALPAQEYEVINYIDESCPADAIGHAYEGSIRTLYQAGILTGNDPFGTFTPNANIIRSEAAAIVSRIVDPTLRKQVQLLEPWEYEDITVAIPYGSTPAEPDDATADGGLELTHKDAVLMVYKMENATAGVTGMTILDVARDELGAELAGSMGASSVTGVSLAFGAKPVYRFDFEVPYDEEVEIGMVGSFYVWLEGTDMYMVAAAAIHDGTEPSVTEAKALLADMVNCTTIGSSSPSIRKVK